MATGGTLPNSITQSVTFFNTTPVIDKDKNIYYVPRFSKTGATAGQEVRLAYLNAFKVVCPPSSAYTDINLSSWSPEDRTLVVKGNIDDFRLVTEEGACLNYFIITRNVNKIINNVLVQKTFYYVFFITAVSQAGGGSVRVTAEPDDFTNVFYLHNKKQLTADDISSDYEPFNEKMSNCYVKRQHYNRVGARSYHSVYNVTVSSPTPEVFNNIVVDSSYELKTFIEGGLSSHGTFKVIAKRYVSNTAELLLEDLNTSRESVEIVTNQFLLFFDSNNQATTTTLDSWSKNGSQSRVDYTPANMKIFMNQEESFKFKYQYRDSKYPISPYDGVFTDEEKEAIENAVDISDLSLNLRNKVVSTCISYLVIETKSPEACIDYRTYTGSTLNVTNILTAGELIDKGLNRPNPVISYPFINSPKVFKKFNIESRIRFKIKISSSTVTYYGSSLIRNILSFLNNSAMSNYVISAYIVSHVGIPSTFLGFQYVTESQTNYIDVTYSLNMPDLLGVSGTGSAELNSVTCYVGGIKHNMLDESVYNHIDYQTSDSSYTFYYVGIIVSGIDEFNYQIPLSILGDIPSSLKLNFYDPVLETEPYKFYSISSYSSYELVFNKNRYYQLGYVNMNYYCSVNGGVKISYVPFYEIDNIETPYYNEGLVFTLASSLPLVSDSYMSYIYQNKAQMKNQYAVADKNFQYDMLQHFFVSGPNAVGVSAGKAGWVGALTETGNQVMQMVDEHIDHAQNKEIIGMNQKAKLADVGNAPDSIKQAGSDLMYDLKTNENFLFLNHYRIDDLSYNSISKLLERIGYQVNLYDSVHAIDRVGWNYVQLISFDWKPTVNIMSSQESKVRQIFLNGVTLLHDKSYLAEGHNYETIIE